MRPLLLVLVLVLVLAAPAGAAQVAYIDGDQVWVATLDGTQKRSLSGPSPDEKQWREVAQADNGSILGVRRDGGKQGTLNTTRLWAPDGAVAGDGTLTAKPGFATYAYPVSLDLTPDAGTVVYGYSNAGFCCPQTFAFGTYAEASKAWFIEPFDHTQVEHGTLAGRRLVGISGTTVMLQDDAGQPPYSTDYTPWFDAGGIGGDVGRVDVAANGRIAAVEVGDVGNHKVAMIPFGSLGGPVPPDGSDCFLPVQGDAQDVSISQDGTSMAWKDDRGVVVAGTPVWFPSAAVSTCNLSRAPVVISPTGRMPSIGPSTAATPPSSPAPVGVIGSPTTSPSAPGVVPRSPAPAGPQTTLARSVRATALRKGVRLTVVVPKAGKVTATGAVARRIVARGSAQARRAGKVALLLKATRASRRRLGRLRGKTLVVKVTAAGRTTTLTRKLR